MPVKQRQTPPPQESPDALAAEVGDDWPLVTSVAAFVVRAGNKTEEVGTWDVTHVEGLDHRRACLADLRDVFDACRQHAEQSGRAASYMISVIGNVPGKGRKPVQTDVELHHWRGRFGAAAEAAGSDPSPIAGMTSFLRAVPGIYEGVANMSERTLHVFAKTQEITMAQIAGLVAENDRLRVEREKTNAAAVEIHRISLETQLTMMREEREARERDLDREASAVAREKQWEQIQAVLGVLMQFGQYVVSSRQGEQHAAAAPPGTVRQDLQRLIGMINVQEQQQLLEHLGDRIWDLLVAASRAPNDDEAIAILHGLREEAKKIGPKLAIGLQAAETLLGIERAMLLKSVLKRSGFSF